MLKRSYLAGNKSLSKDYFEFGVIHTKTMEVGYIPLLHRPALKR